MSKVAELQAEIEKLETAKMAMWDSVNTIISTIVRLKELQAEEMTKGE